VDSLALLLSLPVELEAWLVLGYVAGVLVGARVFEALARVHFRRAQRYAEQGFEYDPAFDHYQCPQGERLSLHLIEPEGPMAIYRAPASSCNSCPLKVSCTPHDEGRHIYRPLAAWAETDIGRFHHRLSLLMFAVGSALSLVGLIRWAARPGTGLLLVALALSLACVAANLRTVWAGSR
jgi:hypothetical protein